MAGAVTDFFGTATVTPGDGRPRELGRILDRNDDLYMNNGYLRLSNNTRVDLRTIIENPPGSGTPNVVTSANALPDNYLVMGDGVRTIQTTTLASTGSTLTVPNAFSAGDGNDAVTLNGVNWPIAAPSAGNILTATNGTTTAWSAPTSVAVTTVASGGGSGDSLVIAGGPGAVTLKDIAGGTGITVTNDADDIIISLTGGAGVTGTGTDNYLVLWNGTTAIDASAISEPTAGNLASVKTINTSTPSNLSNNAATHFVAGNDLGSTLSTGTSNVTGVIVAGNTINGASTIAGNSAGIAILGNSGLTATVSSTCFGVSYLGCTGTMSISTGSSTVGAASSYCTFAGGSEEKMIICSQAVQNTNFANTLTMGYAASTTPATANRTIEFYSSTGSGTIEGTLTQSGSLTDIAEFYENSTPGIIPPGTVVTLVFDGNNTCRPAEPGEHFLGVVSESAAIVLNAGEFTWQGRYEKTKHGKYITEDKPKQTWVPKPGQTEADRPIVRERRESKSYNPNKPYVARSERPGEWSCIATYRGAQVFVRVESTVGIAPGDWLDVKSAGVCEKSATKSRLRVIRVVDPDLCWCFMD